MENSKKETKNSNLFLIICIGIIIGVFIKLFMFEFLYVSGKSMEPSLHDGDKIFVNKLAYGIDVPYGDRLLIQWNSPEINDIVVYLYNNRIVVKRCIAVGGNSLEYSTDSDYNHYLKVGENQIILSDVQYENLKNSSTVPDGFILAVGDNYSESIDSRNYGFVSERNILGRVVCK